MVRKRDVEMISRPGPEHYPFRRRPQLMRFLVLGGLVGLVAGFALAVFGPDAPDSSLLQEIILLGAIGLVFGGFFGSIVYLFADRQSLKK